MYVPSLFGEERLDVLHDAIEQTGLATLVTLTPGGLVATHLPMLLDRARGTHGVLYGHVAAANHQWRDSLPETEALAIFLGRTPTFRPPGIRASPRPAALFPRGTTSPCTSTAGLRFSTMQSACWIS